MRVKFEVYDLSFFGGVMRLKVLSMDEINLFFVIGIVRFGIMLFCCFLNEYL